MTERFLRGLFWAILYAGSAVAFVFMAFVWLSFLSLLSYLAVLGQVTP